MTQTFRDFMEASLYGTDGYYAQREPKRDFFTAPELHPAFAAGLVSEIVEQFRRLERRNMPPPYSIVEMGAGFGVLARDILRLFRERHPEWACRANYIVIERCEDALLRCMAELGRETRVMGYTSLEDAPVTPGVFLSNELVDAFPVHVITRRHGKVREVYVEDGREVSGRLSRPQLRRYAAALGERLGEGDRHAICLEARNWLELVAWKLRAGSLITIDYGSRLGGRALNAPRAFFRHHTGQSVLERPGRQDITTSVDFEQLIQEGTRCGLELVSYGTMSRFLLDRGVLGWLERADYKERNQLKTLIHPDGMGERFKVLIQEKIVPLGASSLAPRGDGKRGLPPS